MKTDTPAIQAPLIIPRTQVTRELKQYGLRKADWAKLEGLVATANVRRRADLKGSIGAMLEALATGRMGLVRLDDPERRVLCLKPEKPEKEKEGQARPDPRDPGAWSD